MWKYKGVELGVEGITGIPANDMTDEEFAEAEGKLARQFPDQLGALSRSGLWEHISDKKYEREQKAEEEKAEVETNVIKKGVDESKVEEDNNG